MNLKILHQLAPEPVRKAIKYVVGPMAASAFTSGLTDAYLVSYPKCGRTWLRVMLGQTFIEEYGLGGDTTALHLNNLWRRDARIPKIFVSHFGKLHEKKPNELSFPSILKNQKVIFMVRDPRDVLVSQYYHVKFRSRIFTGDFQEYLGQPEGGIETISTFYNLMISNQNQTKAMCLVKYEKLHHDPVSELRRILSFLGVESKISMDSIQKAIEYASFDEMKKRELDPSEKHTVHTQPVDPSDERSFKTRKGKVGGYQDELSQKEIDYLNRVIEKNLNPSFDY